MPLDFKLIGKSPPANGQVFTSDSTKPNEGDWQPNGGIPLGTYAAATTTVGGGVSRVNEGPLSMLDPRVGAVLDGIADDKPKFDTAISLLPATGGKIYFPPGTAKFATRYTLSKNGVTLIGASSGASQITGANGVFDLPNVSFLVVSDLHLQATAADLIISSGPNGVTQSSFRDCTLEQGGNFKLWHQTVGSYIDNLVIGCSLLMPRGAIGGTLPGWYVVGSGAAGACNSNTWMRCRCTGGGNFFFHIEEPNGYAYDNAFRDINFELADYGLIRLLGAQNALIENCNAYDQTTTVNDMFYLGTSAVAGAVPCRANVFRGSTRRGGTLGIGKKDIKVVTGDSLQIYNCPGTHDLGSTPANFIVAGTSTTLQNLHASTILIDAANSFVRYPSTPTTGRPPAAVAGPGGTVFDTTINTLITSDGIVWHNGIGTVA